jgi:hypothetical protein
MVNALSSAASAHEPHDRPQCSDCDNDCKNFQPIIRRIEKRRALRFALLADFAGYLIYERGLPPEDLAGHRAGGYAPQFDRFEQRAFLIRGTEPS